MVSNHVKNRYKLASCNSGCVWTQLLVQNLLSYLPCFSFCVSFALHSLRSPKKNERSLSIPVASTPRLHHDLASACYFHGPTRRLTRALGTFFVDRDVCSFFRRDDLSQQRLEERRSAAVTAVTFIMKTCVVFPPRGA